MFSANICSWSNFVNQLSRSVLFCLFWIKHRAPVIFGITLLLFEVLPLTSAMAIDQRYSLIKSISQREFDKDKQIIGLLIENKLIDLADCNEFQVENEPGSKKLSKEDRLRFNLAMAVVKLEDVIEEAGFAPHGFRRIIREFEEGSLRKGRILSESSHRKGYEPVSYPYAALSREAARQRRFNPRLPKFVVEGGCGAGEVPVIFEHPSDLGSAQLIREGFLQLCDIDIKENRDSRKRDLRDCNWEPIAFGRENYLSGRYLIWSYWKDGKCTASTQDIGYYDENKLMPNALRYPLQRTQRACRL